MGIETLKFLGTTILLIVLVTGAAVLLTGCASVAKCALDQLHCN